MAVFIHMKYGFHLNLEQPTDRLKVELLSKMTLAQLLEGQGIPPGMVWMPLINEQLATLDTVVQDNDTISLYPHINGG